MKKYRILSAILTLIMLMGAMTTGVSAAWADKVDEDGKPLIDYMYQVYNNPEEKLADMIKVKEEKGFELWYEEFTGEVALVNQTTGQILFSNPFDIAQNKSISSSVKQKLYSQLLISFYEKGVKKEYNSYTEAALRGQITLKNIKGGIRVEYAIGEPNITRLVPRLISVDRMEKLILANIDNDWNRDKLLSYYDKKDPKDPKETAVTIEEMYLKFPITKDYPVYACTDEITRKQLIECEAIIKQYAPAYTMEQMENDHADTGYVSTDVAPPRFRMALEYIIEDDGLSVTLPANSIEFDESLYSFDTVTLLPYFGTGSNTYLGYTMLMDGSGTLVRFEDVKDTFYNIAGQVYGADYAYHTISGQHAEVIRWPVWGVMTDYGTTYESVYGPSTPLENAAADTTAAATDAAATAATETTTAVEEEPVDRIDYTNGFVAMITEGDSLATIMSEHGGRQHPYNSVYPKFTPRPTDSYELNTGVSANEGSAVWSVSSDRKYTGKYSVRYIMLTDPEIAEEKNLKDTFSTDWVGMALATRDYYTDNGVLTKITEAKDDIPLFIETFGSLQTLEKVASFPVDVDIPLTTFEDIKTMHSELTELGVGNLAFKLTGYANGTINYTTYPAKLNWNKAVGGGDGFAELVTYAEENGFELYPDFDFAYVSFTDAFDGVSLKTDAVRTIDNRYSARRIYDASTQSFATSMAICIAPSVYDNFYEKFGPEYLKYNNTGISVSSLGTDLNSDFDDDEPYHREDNKEYTMEFLSKLDADYKNVMVAGGNAYTMKYADIITNASLTSSKYIKASETIPFTGVVLHGSKVFTGTTTNMEGDINEAILHSIENGAYLYFTLSYQNTNRLKEDERTSSYYSVNYEIWKEDVAKYYNTLNEALHDLQTSYIVDHEFIKANRVPDADEVEADASFIAAGEQERAEALAAAELKIERAKRLQTRLLAQGLLTADDMVDYDAEWEVIQAEFAAAEEAAAEEAAKLSDKYLTESGSVIRVEYEGDVNFLLNYNSFSVTIEYNGETYELKPVSFIRID
ncbi:MAG: hypothetical protein E7658_03810 [Ruminococcaceae bacterium]|nr:hypothetical protein [Oscillospiraceae bacterium]